MNKKNEKDVELIEVPQLVSIPQNFATGPMYGRFLTALRDEKKILGNKCESCGRTQIPPRLVCAMCDVEVTEFFELGPGGYVTTFDVVFIPTINPLTGKMREVPYTTCSIVLDGGDAVLMHFLDETDPDKILVNNRVEAVFRPDGERTGSPLDIKYFRVIPGEVRTWTMSSTNKKYAYEVPGKLEIPYKYMAGKTGSKFLTALRDEKKILAMKCDQCNTVFAPPRSVCDRCYKRIDDWVEVGPKGTVTSFTVVRYWEPHLPMKPPFVMALIKLDGADTAMTHIISGVRPEDVKIGMRVEAVFAKERKARITDIEYFRPEKKKAKPKKAAKKKAAKKKPAKKKVSGKKVAKKRKKTAAKKAAKKRSKKAVKKVKKSGRKAVRRAAKKAVKKKAGEKKPASKRAAKKKAAKKKSIKKTAKKKSVRKKGAGRKSR